MITKVNLVIVSLCDVAREIPYCGGTEKMTNSWNPHNPQGISITHKGDKRVVLYSSDEQHSFTGMTVRRHVRLKQTSQTTTFSRQLELFCGESLTERGIDSDRKIQHIAHGIRNLDGVSCNFDEMVVEQFHKDGRKLLLESIDFDKGHLEVVEIQNDPLISSRNFDDQKRTIEELWELVVQDTDYRNEEMLQKMRKIVHRLEGIEKRLQELRNHNNSGRTRKALLEYTQDLIYLNKNLNKIFADKGELLFGLDAGELDKVQTLLDCEDEDKVNDALEILGAICRTPDINKLRKWLLRNIPLSLVVLLFDNSKSMLKERMTTLSFCKQFIETLKKSPKLTAVAVCTIGDGPGCLIPFTLARDFNVNDLDIIQHKGCTPLTTSVKFARNTLQDFIGDDENKGVMSGYIIMITDLKPTEEWNGGFSEYNSNPKDESQECPKKFTKLVDELKDTITTVLKDIPLVIAVTDRSQLEYAKALVETSEKGHVLDISTNSFHPILANPNLLHQMYELCKGDMDIAEQLQSVGVKNTLNKVIRDNKKLAEMFEILETEWLIKMGSKTIGLSLTGNNDFNRKAIREEFQKKSIVVPLQIEGKRRNCRIFSNKRSSSSSISGSINYEKKSTDDSYQIRVPSDDGNVDTHKLVKKQQLEKKTKEADKNS
ncbi:uncharacterized protein LOC125660710 isoform X2 [Ostrea edulis]|uniref:uncharacterized protein LOC125660710 isoform X2 n=1 Tax=Ostrea edulis TaxID=37623 RepID=UPI0024AFB9C4|nr:uncharacterized protein LOC125660710 isoform X2 [Ostrea edulis]